MGFLPVLAPVLRTLAAALLLLLLRPGLFAQTLREAAERRNFLVGAAHNGSFSDSTYLETMAREYNQVEPENATKFQPLRPSREQFNFTVPDQIIANAAQRGQLVRGHTFIWHQAVPNWLANGTFTPAQLSDILREHILTVGARYRGKIYAWDVVNEAFNDNGTLRSTLWYDQPGIGRQGTGYIEQAFRWAREADPKALLFYNDYSAEGVNVKSDAILGMARDFRARGVPIDGIGLQAHWGLSNQGSIASLDNNIRRITDLGLQVHITELDVRVPVNAAGVASAADLAAQATLYRSVADTCLKYPLCTSIQTWGYTDKYSWIPGFYPGFGAALPMDAAFQPKPAYTAMRDALLAAPPVDRPALPAPIELPVIAARGLVSAASYQGSAVAPGEIVVLFGATQGPASLLTALVTGNRLPTDLGRARLFFDNVPAPLLYGVKGQVSAIVPFAVATRQQTVVQYEYEGIRSLPVTLPVVEAKPGLFTWDASGKGPVASLTASYVPITRDAPIDKGDVALLFLTGAGQTGPVGVDGQIVSSTPLPVPNGIVTATVGGIAAEVLYAGGAAGLVNGGIQVNLRIPSNVGSGEQPVVISVGGVASPAGPTIPVR